MSIFSTLSSLSATPSSSAVAAACKRTFS
ncbi:Vmc-like lipoprotein signal peptide domain-containing protein [Accumulibacter sp.]